MKYSTNLNELSKEQLDQISSILNEMLSIRSNVIASDEDENQFYEGCADTFTMLFSRMMTMSEGSMIR